MTGKANTINTESTVAGRIGFFLVCSTIVWTTLIYGTVHQPIISFYYLVVGAIFVCWMIDSLRSGFLRFDPSLFQIPLFALAVYGLIQVIPFGSHAAGGLPGIPSTISFDPYSTKQTSLHILALAVFLPAALIFIDTRKRLKTVVRMITIFGFLFAFYAILQTILSPNKIYGIYSAEGADPFGSFVNRHNFAAFMEMSIAVPLGLLLSGAIHKDKRLLFYTAIAVAGTALLLSGSRGGLVSIVAGVAFMVMITHRKQGKRRLFMKIAAAVVICGAVVAGAMLIGGESSLTRIADSASSSDFTSNRNQIWKVSIEVIKNNQPFGVGLGGFGVAYTKYDPSNGLARAEQAHNDYLQVLLDAGIVGVVIGLMFIFFLFRDGLKAVKTRDKYLNGVAAGSLSGCFAILVHSLFDFVLHTTAISLLFLLLAAMCGVCLRIARSQREERETVNEPPAASVTPINQNVSA